MKCMSRGICRCVITVAALIGSAMVPGTLIADDLVGPPGSIDPSFRAELEPGVFPDHLAQGPDGSWVLSVERDFGRPTLRTSVIKLSADGARIANFQSPEVVSREGYIKALAVDSSGRVYVSGKIPSAQGIEYLIRLNAEDGRRDETFPRLLGYDQQLSWILPARNGGLWVYGFMEDETRSGLQLLAPSGAPVPSFHPGLDAGGNGALEDAQGRLWLFPPYRRLLSDGSEDPEFDPPAVRARLEDPDSSTGSLRAMALDAEGRFLLAGDFAKVGEHPSAAVARLLPNGQVDPSFRVRSCDGEVGNILVEPSGKIIACGNFSRMGGDSHLGVARLMPDGSLDRTYVAGLSGNSYRQFMDREGRLLVRQMNPTDQSPLVRLRSGELASSPPRIARQPVDASARAGGLLKLGVQFRTSEPAQLQWFHNGREIPGATQAVYQLNSARVTNSGSYTVRIQSALGSTVSRTALVAVHPPVAQAGWPDPRFDCGRGPDDQVTVLLPVGDHRLLIGGYFATFSGRPARGLVAVDDTGRVDAEFLERSPAFSPVHALIRYDEERIVVGGKSAAPPGKRTEAGWSVARLFVDGRTDPTFRSRLANASVVRSILPLSSGRLLLAGELWLTEAPFRRSVVRVLPDGSVDSTFQFSPSNPLLKARACAAPNGRFWLAGQDASSEESLILSAPEEGAGPATLFAKWSARTQIRALLPGSDGSLWVSGDFDLTNHLGQRVKAALQLRPDGTLSPRDENKEGFWGPVGDALAADAAGRVLVGTLAGASRVLPDGHRDPSWLPRVGDAVTALAASPAGDVYLAGPFRQVNGVRRNFLARVYGEDRTEPYLLGPYLTPDGFELTLETFEGWVYELEIADELPPNGTWTSAATFTGSGSSMVIRNPNPSQPHRFHRVRVRLAGDPRAL